MSFEFLMHQSSLSEVLSVLRVVQFIKRISAEIIKRVALELTSHNLCRKHKIVKIGSIMLIIIIVMTMTISNRLLVLLAGEIRTQMLQIRIKAAGIITIKINVHQTAVPFDATAMNPHSVSYAKRKAQIRIDRS